jgi:hypothetical protein
MNYLPSHRSLALLTLAVVTLTGCRHPSCCFAEGPSTGVRDRRPGRLIAELTCVTNRVTSGETLVMTIRVANPTGVPQEIDIRGFSWEEIEQIERRRADMQSRMNDPPEKGSRPNQKQIDMLDTMLTPYRQSAAPQVIGLLHITDLLTKETRIMDRVNTWCGTGRQFASMPPGSSVTNRIEIGPSWLPQTGEFGIEFHTFGRVDGKRKPVAVSNQVRVSVLAPDKRSSKVPGNTQQSVAPATSKPAPILGAASEAGER